jgi:rhodanese-related sulfurtransferase
MNIRTIAPQRATELLAAGAKLLDIREADEHARERILQAQHAPLTSLEKGLPAGLNDSAIIFHCKSGNRTRAHAQRLAACASGEVYILEGGLDAWKRAGYPVISDRSQPIELQRQVQIAAGSLAVLGVALGATVSAAFYVLAGMVGAGLMFAGLTGTCGMARLLQLMPWNRRSV